MMPIFYFTVAALLFFLQYSYSLNFGFGKSRLSRREQGLKLKSSSTCDGIEELWYAGAVVDNFSPIEAQQFWSGLGQRYWFIIEIKKL